MLKLNARVRDLHLNLTFESHIVLVRFAES